MKMNYEMGGRSLSSLDREPKRLNEETLSTLESLMSEKMEPLDLAEIGESIGVAPEEVAEDVEYVRTTKDKINRSNELTQAIAQRKKELGLSDREVSNYYERLGHLFEGFLYSNISQSKIFKDLILHKTTEFDDIKNGVDFVAEVQNPDDPKSYVALAMDASFSMAPALINQKIERSLIGIKNNKLSEVKYFEFEEGASEARLGVPRVVVGTDEDSVRSLLQRWHTQETIPGSEVSFAEDPVWTFMALQVSEQLKMFVEEAEFFNKKETAETCRKYLTALEKSLKLNRSSIEKHKLLMAKDGTSIAISEFCKNNIRELVVSKQMHIDSAGARRDDQLFNDAIRRN